MGSYMNSIEVFQNIREESKIELEKILKIKKILCNNIYSKSIGTVYVTIL